jgi:hypothetical protein
MRQMQGPDRWRRALRAEITPVGFPNSRHRCRRRCVPSVRRAGGAAHVAIRDARRSGELRGGGTAAGLVKDVGRRGSVPPSDGSGRLVNLVEGSEKRTSCCARGPAKHSRCFSRAPAASHRMRQRCRRESRSIARSAAEREQCSAAARRRRSPPRTGASAGQRGGLTTPGTRCPQRAARPMPLSRPP